MRIVTTEAYKRLERALIEAVQMTADDAGYHLINEVAVFLGED